MVVHAYYPLAEPRVQREAGAARDAGFDVTVFALKGATELPEEAVDGIRVRRVGLAHRRGAGLRRMLIEYISFCAAASWWLAAHSLRHPFDIVHFHNPPDFLLVAGLLPRARGSKLILDIHDLSSHMFAVRVPGRLGQLVPRLLIWLERAACALADSVITVHQPYRDELLAHGVPATKVHVVMNSLDHAVLERSRRVPSMVERSAHFRLAYHGTLTSWYGIDLLIDALRQLRTERLDIDAVVLGDGDALPTLRAQLTAAGLERYVYLSGRYVPIEQALATVAAADCGVIPNRPSEINRFALSSKLFEYVELGIPVVVAELQTLAAHFGPDEVTFFEPGSAASLANAIRWVYSNREQALAKSERARLRATQYSWSRNKDALVLAYSSLRPVSPTREP